MEQKLGIKISELEDDMVVEMDIGGQNLAVVKHQGRLRVLQGRCTHEGGALGKGRVEGEELICPLHAGAFDLETGAASKNTPWVTDIKIYRTRVDNVTGDIYVEV